MRARSFALLPALFLLASCAGPITQGPLGSSAEIRAEEEKQQTLVYQRALEEQVRLSDIAFPILGANAEFCRPRTRPNLGLTAWNIHGVPRQYQRAASGTFNLGEKLAVQSVAPASPARKAGVQSGDVILAVNGAEIPEGKNAAKTMSDLVRQSGNAPVTLTLSRDGKAFEKTVTPIEVCDFPVLLDYNNTEINAFADGEKIVVTKGIVRFAENDNEVAMVVAHELAHSALEHVGKLRQNATMGALGGIAIDTLFAAAGVSTGGQFAQIGADAGAMRYSVPFEQEADYVGMYFMERAGYNSAGVANFWRRMAAEGQSSITTRTTHPSSPERFIAIERTHDEIKGKKNRVQALAPNMAKGG